MEIVVSARNFDEFFIALEKGADAVCVNLKAFGGKRLVKNVSLEELALMVPYAQKTGKKVFVVINSFIKETELNELIDVAVALNEIKPHAIVIQDLGLFWLFKQRFPHLVLHASTFMGCYNVLEVKKLASMGFKRISLAKELTLEEIEEIRKEVSSELEIFVHGDFCFSYSGLCLASSYLGGRSSTRGRCRQPCCFLYRWEKEKGYYLSCKTLCALELVPILRKLGVNAIRIGRIKNIEYLATVVEIYRLIRDTPLDQLQMAINYAGLLLNKKIKNRYFSTGFFLSPEPKDILIPQHFGNLGVYLGKVIKREEDKIYFYPEAELKLNGLIRAEEGRSGKKIVWKAKSIHKKENTICVNGPLKVEPGYLLFQDSIVSNQKKKKASKHQLMQTTVVNLHTSHSFKKRLRQWIYAQGIEIPQKKVKRITWWIHHEEVNYFLKYKLPKNSIPILSLNSKTYHFLIAHFKKLLKKHPFLTLSLPPIILPQQLNFFKTAIEQLLNLGFMRWQIASIGQFELFPRMKGLVLSSSYTFNVINHLALRVLKNLGVRFLSLSLETDRNIIKALLKYWSPQDIVINVFIRAPLWTSRLDLKPIKKSKPLVSPLEELYYPITRDDVTYVLPENFVSLKDFLPELMDFGIYQFGIDLKFILKKEANRIVTSKGVFLPKGSYFNYKRGLV